MRAWRRLWGRIRGRRGAEAPAHLATGRRGEEAARAYLVREGLVFLTANFRGRRGEIDLVLRERDCLVFAEVKTRSAWNPIRPAAAVNRAKRRRLVLTAEEYVRQLPDSRVRWRFDVVEVLADDSGGLEVRHLPNAFNPDDTLRRRR